ncbi:MAG TPA: amidohydrolase, partial [Candidatus Acidoferrum sp.]|nr:amidohydrolase [Candidatus Acidoferrum sp.]
MSHPSRREFLGYTGGLGAFALMPTERVTPELILYNGNFITIDTRQPRAQAVAISGGRFLAVGSNDDVRALATALTKSVDLGGKTVTPGFIDAHTHPAESGREHLREVDCDLRSISAIQTALRARAAQTPAAHWVLGFKYDDTKTAEGRPLTREDLDAVDRQHPIAVTHRGGHTTYYNSMAFQLAGIDEKSPDASNGKIDRDPATRRPSGRVAESAREPFYKIIPSTYTRDDRREGVKLISKMMSRTGITSVHDAFGSPNDLQAYQDARDAGELSLRVYCLIGYQFIDQMIAAGVRTGLGDEWVRVGAMKAICDGSCSERTARLSAPYVGRPNDFGILVMDEEEMYSHMHKAHAAGWQIGTHANGDVAIDKTLKVYERLQRESPRRDPRFRLEHCTVIN